MVRFLYVLKATDDKERKGGAAMKKWIACACASTLVLSAVTVDVAHAKKLILRGVTKQDTTMYERRGKDPIAVIPASEVILIRNREKVWTKVEYNNEYGFVLTAHLKFAKTNKEKEEDLAKSGAKLLKRAKAFRKVVDKGNLDTISLESLKFEFEVSKYASEVSAVNPGKAARERLTKQYVNPARRELKRIQHELTAWDQLKQAETYIKAMQYDEAKKTYNAALASLKAGKALRKKNNYPALSKKFQQKLDKQSKKIKTRFTYSTLTDLINEGHVKFLADFQFTALSTKTPFVDSNGKKHTNGFVTRQSPLVQSSVMLHLRNGLDEVYDRDVPIFKKMRYTVARSKASNNIPLTQDVTVTLRGTNILNELTTIAPMNEPIEKETSIEHEPTIFFDFRDVPPDIAIVDLKFYR